MSIIILGPKKPPINGSYIVTNSVKSILEKNGINYCWIDSNTSKLSHKKYLKIIFTIRTFLKLSLYLRSSNFSVVYIAMATKHSGLYRDAIYIMISKLFRRRVIIHLHNKPLESRFRSFSKMILNICFVIANDIIILSDSMKKYYNFSRLNRIHVIPNYVKLSKPIIRDLDSVETRILMMTNLYKFKGVFDALEVISKLPKDYSLVIAGTEGDISKDQLQSRINLMGLNNRIDILGPIFGKQKRDILSDAHILLHPTYDDCQPLVIVEAMHYGCIPVATKVGAIPDMIRDGENGFLLEKGDVEGMAHAISKLGELKTRRRMTAVCQNSLASLKNYNRFSTDMLNLFSDINQRHLGQ